MPAKHKKCQFHKTKEIKATSSIGSPGCETHPCKKTLYMKGALVPLLCGFPSAGHAIV